MALCSEYGAPRVIHQGWTPINIPSGTRPTITVPNIVPPTINVSIPSTPSVPSKSFSVPVIPTISSLSIQWFPINITIPTLTPIDIEEYIPYNYTLPSSQIPSYMDTPPEPSPIDYNIFKPSFFSYDYIYIPFYRTNPKLPDIEKFFSGDFNPAITIPENEFKEIDIDLLSLIQNMGYSTGQFYPTQGSYLNNVGSSRLDYFNREWQFLSRAISEFLESARGILSLSKFVEQIKSYLAYEKYSFKKYAVGKERELLLFKFISSVFAQRVKYKDEFLATKLSEVASNLKDIILKNESDFNLKSSEEKFRELLAKVYINNINRESGLVDSVNTVNRILLDMFKLYNRIFVIITSIEALNIERDRLITERMVAMKRLEEAQRREDIAVAEREVLLEKDKIYSERITYLNAEINRLISLLNTAQTEADAQYKELLARRSLLYARGITTTTEATLAKPKAELELIDSYLSTYIRYVDIYLRVMREYIRAKYEVLSYPIRLNEAVDRSLLNIERVKSLQNNYLSIYNSVYRDFQYDDFEVAKMFAQAKISAQIIESFQ